jgi:hypothetical protein
MIRRAFDRGNYAAAYETTSLGDALDGLPADDYLPAFILGFCASLEGYECEDLEAVLDAERTPAGQACLTAGYCESKLPACDDESDML